VDINGDVITVGQNSDSWAKLKGTGPGIGGIVPPLGPQKTGDIPYSYSDMTGSLASLTTQQGFWTVIYDSTVLGTYWGRVYWNSLLPPNSQIQVQVRAADNLSLPLLGNLSVLGNQVYKTVSNQIPFGNCHHPLVGRYIEIRTMLSRTRPKPAGVCPATCAPPFDPSPILYDLTVEGLCCDTDRPPPTCSLSCNSLSVPCDDATGARVFYKEPQMVGGCYTEAGVTCEPVSGSRFPVGPSEIRCRTFDDNGDEVTCTIGVLVSISPHCPEPTGACCVAFRNNVAQACLDGVTLETCDAKEGRYLGDESLCRDGCAPPCVANNCLDGQFCNGCETSDSASGECRPSAPPCPTESICREAIFACVTITRDIIDDFVDCLDGPDAPLVAGCVRFDFDDDGHIDLEDLSRFQNFFTGR